MTNKGEEDDRQSLQEIAETIINDLPNRDYRELVLLEAQFLRYKGKFPHRGLSKTLTLDVLGEIIKEKRKRQNSLVEEGWV